jgi:hypothetical protein
MQKVFFCHGLLSGILLRAAVRGYDIKNEAVSLTVLLQQDFIATGYDVRTYSHRETRPRVPTDRRRL